MKITALAVAILLASTTTQASKFSEISCLAKNIYHESRGEPTAGKYAVAAVTINRVNSQRFPDTVCDVVFQPKQFSWTHNKYARVTSKKEWDTAILIAIQVVGTTPRFKALYYHNLTVKPKWSFGVTKYALIGDHQFYVD